MNDRNGAPDSRRRCRLVTRPSDRVIEARSPEGSLLAHFNPRTNETRNSHGDLIGTGNRLPALLRDWEERSPRTARGGK